MLRSKFPSLCITAILCLSYSNCAFMRREEASTRPHEEIVFLKLDPNNILYVSKLDGKLVWADVKDHLELSPGIHTLSLNFRKSRLKGQVKNFREFDLSFDAKAGGKYKIEFNANNDFSKWSACILDVADRRRVSTQITDTD